MLLLVFNLISIELILLLLFLFYFIVQGEFKSFFILFYFA